MIRRRALMLGALTLLATATAARAQHAHETAAFDGRWTLSFTSQMGPLSMNLELENHGGVVEGLAKSQGGDMVVQGAQDDADVTFTIFIRQPDHEVDLDFSGTVDGESASGTVAILGEIYEWTAERSKEP